MTGFRGSKMRWLSVGCVVAVVFGHAGIAKADFVFGEPVRLGAPINSPAAEGSLTMTPDGLELYFDSSRQGWDLWVTRRATVSDPWGEPERVWFTVNNCVDFGPCLSADGLELYYSSNRDKAFNTLIAKRATLSDPWEEPVNIGPAVSRPAGDFGPSISPDGLELIFGSDRSGGFGPADLWVTRRETVNDSWGEAENLGSAVNSPAVDNSPFIAPDGLLLFFESDRPGGYGDFDIWVSKRKTTRDEWGKAVNLGPPINSKLTEYLPGTSLDGSRFYFIKDNVPGFESTDIWEAPIVPVVDFNADGIVDSADMCIMVDHWGTDHSLCDIGPMPWGDGVVDIEDLKVLAEHLFENVSDPTLVAHWPLDEIEGMIVSDLAGDNMGYALGDPLWLAEGGQMNGALQLDGMDDYVVTGAIPKPEAGAYSMLAWIKNGAPGQVVLSQMGKTDWLGTDPSGAFMTQLTMGGWESNALHSDVVITDGDWHRIGFVWDGSCGTLYVDGIATAEDSQDHLDISTNGLYIGTGKAMQPGTFWSGLIDDVRIYDRIVSP